jgi:hypothetical protein
MNKLIPSLAVLALTVLSALGANVDLRSFNTNDFTTNVPSFGYVALRSHSTNVFTNLTVLNNATLTNVSLYGPFIFNGTLVSNIFQGTNLVVSSNGVAIVPAATNLDLWPGANITLSITNRAGHADIAISASGGGGGGSGVGPGTLNHLSMFNSTTTNVVDSNLTQTDTNQWQYRTAAPGTTFTNGMTNIWWEKYISAGTNRGLKIIENGNLCEIKQFSTEVIAPGGDVFAGMKLNDAWLINGSGTVANGGHNGDLLPMADSDGTTGITIGNSVNKVKSIALSTGSAGGVLMPDNGYVQSAGVYAVWGGSGWLLHYKTSNYDFFGAFATGSPNGPCVSVASGTYAGNSIANGSGSVSSAVADCFFGPGKLAHSWALNTNNNATGAQSIARLTGTENLGATDGLGGDLILGGGSGTSLGRSGNLRLQTSPPLAATGNSAQTYQDRFVMTGVPVTLTTNSATTICTFTVPTSLTVVGGEFSATTEIKDATDVATVHERFAFNAINKAGTVTAAVQSVPTITSPLATGSAGVTTTWTVTVSSTTVSIKCNAVTTGINATTARVLGPRIELDSDGTSVVTFQ